MRKQIPVLFAVLLAMLAIAGCAAAKPTVSAIPATPVTALTLREFVIHTWSLAESTPEGRKLLQQLVSGPTGRQSRDLGDQILEAAVAGKVKRKPGCFPYDVRLYDAEWEKTKEAVVWINGERKVLSEKGTFEVLVCSSGPPDRADSWFGVTPQPEWNAPAIAMEVCSPFAAGERSYPSQSACLKTCGRATVGRCGGPYTLGQPTRLFQLLSEQGVSHFHVVVK